MQNGLFSFHTRSCVFCWDISDKIPLVSQPSLILRSRETNPWVCMDIKWENIFAQTLINFRTARMDIFDYFIISLFCSFFSIKTLRRTYFMNACSHLMISFQSPAGRSLFQTWVETTLCRGYVCRTNIPPLPATTTAFIRLVTLPRCLLSTFAARFLTSE